MTEIRVLDPHVKRAATGKYSSQGCVFHVVCLSAYSRNVRDASDDHPTWSAFLHAHFCHCDPVHVIVWAVGDHHYIAMPVLTCLPA